MTSRFVVLLLSLIYLPRKNLTQARPNGSSDPTCLKLLWLQLRAPSLLTWFLLPSQLLGLVQICSSPSLWETPSPTQPSPTPGSPPVVTGWWLIPFSSPSSFFSSLVPQHLGLLQSLLIPVSFFRLTSQQSTAVQIHSYLSPVLKTFKCLSWISE
jgi:hypothetical protein